MDTVLCGSTAYQYWRTPPIVHLLAAAPEDHPALRFLIDSDELQAFRALLDSRTQFACGCVGPAWRNVREESKTIREYHRFLAPFAELPVDILVYDSRDRRASSIVEPWLWSVDMPFGSMTNIVDDLYVTSPAFTLLQLASKTGLVRTVLLASELCGTYAVYQPPAPVAELLNKLAVRGKLRSFGGWKPGIDANGQLTGLWSRDPLLTPQDLLEIADVASPQRGCKRLCQAAELVMPMAASPFETQAGILLGFSRRRGGEGYTGCAHNVRVDLSRDAKLVAQRGYCSCDLYWPDGLDIECQSAQHHDNEGSFLSDADRSAALELMGVKVLPLTYAQLKDEDRFAAFSAAVAHARGIKLAPKTAAQAKAAENLRAEVMVDWATLPFLGR